MSYYLYASQMWRARHCPGSVKATRRVKDEASGTPTLGETEYGSELHALTEEVINGELELEKIDLPEREYVHRCIEFLNGREIKGETESPLFVLVAGELIASCRADLVSVNEEQGEVLIPDWKFYRAPLEEAEWGLQGITMCAAALQEHAKCHVAVAIAYLPILGLTYEQRLDRELLEETVLQIYGTYKEANEENPKLNPGPWCARCEALAACPAANDVILDLAKSAGFEEIRRSARVPTVEVLKERFYTEIESWSRGRFLGYVEMLPYLPALTDSLRKRLRRELEQGITHTHWRLTDKRRGRKASVPELRRVLGDLCTPEEFDELLTPAWGPVQEFLKKKGLSDKRIAELLAPFDQGKRKEVRRV